MQETPREIVLANLAFMAFWVLVVASIWVSGRRWPRLHSFRQEMLAQWKPSLVVTLLFLLGMGLGGRGIINPYAIAVFCQSLVGLALARRAAGFEPLPVTQAVVQRERPWRKLALMLVIAFLLVWPALIIGNVGLSIGRQIFGETNLTQEAASMLPTNRWTVFFVLLAGAGIAEETTYRLVILSLLWRLTRRGWLANILSALAFGAYHLLPLNGMYRVFLGFPVSQFLASTLIGLIWGWAFMRRGYETAVLSHTFSDWIPLLIFGGS